MKISLEVNAIKLLDDGIVTFDSDVNNSTKLSVNVVNYIDYIDWKQVPSKIITTKNISNHNEEQYVECWCCRSVCKNIIGVPIFYKKTNIKGEYIHCFKIIGNTCSFSCTATIILEDSLNPYYKESFALLNLLYYLAFGEYTDIPTRLNWTWRQYKGGGIFNNENYEKNKFFKECKVKDISFDDNILIDKARRYLIKI